MKTLTHYGIRGMRWGIRRQVGPDGLIIRRSKRKSLAEDYTEARKLKKKGYKNLSNNELTSLTRRLQLERQFRDLNPNAINKGKDALKTVSTLGKTAAAVYTLGTTPLGQAVIKALSRR